MPQSLIERLTGSARTARGRVLGGSAVLLTGLGLVTLTNLAYNIAVARYLGPIAFGHTTAVYTLLILISAVTLSFQILTAKIVAQHESPEAQSLAYKGFHRQGWAASAFVSLLLLFFRDTVTNYLHLQDSMLIVLLAIGTLFYVPLGCRRGYIQGICKFEQLALNLILEGFVRLFGSLLMIHLGFAVRGVIAANAAAVMIAYLAAPPKLYKPSGLIEVPVPFSEGLQAAVFFAGQVIINNCDIVVVKHFFPPASAGVYAAVALVGRVVFAFSWAIVSSMFPISAGAVSRKQEDRGLLGISLLLVLGIFVVFTAGLRLAPGLIWTHLFGAQFGTAGGSNFRYLLVLYAATTGVYGLSIVIIAYEMSRKIANTGWTQLVFSVLVVAGIYLFHSSLAQVIWVQMTIMGALFIAVALPFLAALVAPAPVEAQRDEWQSLRLLRRVTEDEVIAEFLKNDFRSPEFRDYQNSLDAMVMAPDLENEQENRVRRALFKLRHGSLWRELPRDTDWFEIELRPQDLQRVRVFPRAHWRRLALGNFGITHVLSRVPGDRSRRRAAAMFRAKIQDLRRKLRDGVVANAVLLIGLSENAPLTVLDGNHRLVAAMLTSPEAIRQLRFYCGISADMRQCCWYQTSVSTLIRYGTNMVRHSVRDPENELVRLLEEAKEIGVRAA